MSQSVFINAYVSNPPALILGAIGNGTLTINKLSHFTVAQSYTAVCTAVDPFTVFRVIGSLDGAVGIAIVGEEFTDLDNKVFLVINQGPTAFEISDSFEFEVVNGTDLNQENLDIYNEKPQKNFGPGIVGLDKGDENLRYVTGNGTASAIIGDLKISSKQLAESGNPYTVAFKAGAFPSKASIFNQGVEYTYQTPGLDGNSIYVEVKDFLPATYAEITTQGMLGISAEIGEEGNYVSIDFVGGGSAGSETITISQASITVGIENGFSTVNDCIAAIAGDSGSNELITFTPIGAGTETVYIASPVQASGGRSEIGLAGSEVAVVEATSITIYCELGVTDLSGLVQALNNNADIGNVLLVDYIQTGVDTKIIEVSGPIYLEGGGEGYSVPGQEIFEYVGTDYSATWVSGEYTSSELKTLLESNVDFDAAFSVELTGDGSEIQTLMGTKAIKGGFSGPTYSFNEDELDDHENFHEGNANLLVDCLVVQGDSRVARDQVIDGEQTIKKDLTVEGITILESEASVGGNLNVEGDIANKGNVDTEGIQSLRDQSGLSGSDITNVQATLNALRDQAKVFYYNEGHEGMLWEAPTLTLATDLFIEFAESGRVNKILAANTPIDLLDGEHLFVAIDKNNNSDVTVVKDTVLPSGEFVTRICSRIGDYLIWSDNTLHQTGKVRRIGEVGITRLQNEDVYSEQELVDLGKDRTYLTHDAKIYIAALDKTLEQAIADDDFAGGGIGIGLKYDTYGNVTIKMTPEVDTLILQSPDGTYWGLSITDHGEMITETKLSGTIDLIKFYRDIAKAIIQLKVNDDGALLIDTVTDPGQIFDAVFFKAPNGVVWDLKVDSDNNLYTVDGEGNCWKVTNELDELVFGFKDSADGVVHVSKETMDVGQIGDPNIPCGNGVAWRWGKNLDGIMTIFSWDAIKERWADVVLRMTQPLGSTIDFWGKEEKIPTGFMAAEGQELLISEYPELFEVLGWTHGGKDSANQLMFRLPDTRGRFIRGIDSGRGIDVGLRKRTQAPFSDGEQDGVGSLQHDAYQGHQHMSLAWTNSGNAFGGVGPVYGAGGSSNGVATKRQYSTSGDNRGDGVDYGEPRYDHETRPTNIYAYKIMRVR